MHYLEAIIELLEYLPEEVRKKCIELQQLDLQYQEKMDKLKIDSRELATTHQSLTPSDYERRHKDIQQRYQEAHAIADGKVQITEYLQSVLEKYQERVMKELMDFKADLEIDNMGEVDLIEKEFIQSITSPAANQMNDQQKGGGNMFQQFNEDSNESMPSTSSAPQQALESDSRQNGFGLGVEGTPKTHLQFQRGIKNQPDEFKVPNFRRPSQSVDSRISMLQRGIDEDIFDTEISPPTKRQKPSNPQRLAIGYSTKSSRDNSPRSSHSSSHSPSSTSPAIGQPFSKFPFHSRFSASSMAMVAESSSSSHIAAQNPAISAAHSLSLRQLQETGESSNSSFAGGPAARQSALIKMPSFAEAQSFHGRPRKLTKKVEQMLIGNRTSGVHPTNRQPPTQPPIRRRRRRKQQQPENEAQEDEQLEEIDEEFGEEEDEDYDEKEVEGEEEEEEADDRAWCYCKQGSAGNMVACDNLKCPYVWFHYECVGIQQAPKGAWFCPTCSMKMNAVAQKQQRSRSTSTDQQQQKQMMH